MGGQAGELEDLGEDGCGYEDGLGGLLRGLL